MFARSAGRPVVTGVACRQQLREWPWSSAQYSDIANTEASIRDVNEHALNETVKAMVVSGRGIFAADESTGTIDRRLGDIGVENTESNRRAY